MTLLSELTEREQSAAHEAGAQYNAIVRQLADGTNDPGLDEVGKILSAIGKSSAELTNDVTVARHRNSLRSKMTAAEQAEGDRDDALKQIETAKSEFEAARQRFVQTTTPLDNRLSEINELRAEAERARRELLSQCPDQELSARLSSIRGELKHLDQCIKTQSALVDRIKANLKGEQSQRKPAGRDEWRRGEEGYEGGDPAAVARIQKRFDIATSELTDLESQRVELRVQEQETLTEIIYR